MNINPKKSWHVFSDENVTKVLKDERAAREEEANKQKKILAAEQEVRLSKLRQRAAAKLRDQDVRSSPGHQRRSPPRAIRADGPVLVVDLSPYADAGALQNDEAVTMDQLKEELRARGVKCGGTRVERCNRLFEVLLIRAATPIQSDASPSTAVTGEALVSVPADAIAVGESALHPLVSKNPSQHLNLFEEEEQGTAGTAENPEYMAEKKAEEKKLDDQLTTYVGQGCHELGGEMPFYLRTDTVQGRIGRGDDDVESGLAMYKNKAEAQHAIKLYKDHARMDPLAEMNALMGRDPSTDTAEEGNSGRPAEQLPALSIAPDTQVIGSSSRSSGFGEKDRRKRKEWDGDEVAEAGGSRSSRRSKRKEKKRRKKEREKEKARQKEAKLEGMRRERLTREGNERNRATAIFSSSSGLGGRSAPGFQMELDGQGKPEKQRYNSSSGYAHFTGGVARN